MRLFDAEGYCETTPYKEEQTPSQFLLKQVPEGKIL